MDGSEPDFAPVSSVEYVDGSGLGDGWGNGSGNGWDEGNGAGLGSGSDTGYCSGGP